MLLSRQCTLADCSSNAWSVSHASSRFARETDHADFLALLVQGDSVFANLNEPNASREQVPDGQVNARIEVPADSPLDRAGAQLLERDHGLTERSDERP